LVIEIRFKNKISMTSQSAMLTYIGLFLNRKKDLIIVFHTNV